ncbi:MAG TPA: permease-like cell division protein FtsX [Thermomonas sp.]|jgi:cell division transport system permease protein|nr:permease-like cell division protein FtsX [Thermomonas sp.]HQY49209.1 permease-like cell division protein FtsX [Thermomonas sp.]
MNERSTATHSSRTGAWLAHHGFSLTASLGRMLRTPWASCLTIAVMALALALPLGLWLVLQNVATLSGQVDASHGVTLYLKPGTDAAHTQAVAQSLQQRADVAKVATISPEQALADMQKREDLATAIDILGADAARAALPPVLQVTPRTGNTSALITTAQALPEIDRVQFDAQWRDRLQAWLAFALRTVQVLAVLLGLGALLVVGNTVRLDIQSRREEIGVLQLLGASDGFVRRPFLYLGAWYGLAAGGLALAILTAAQWALRQPLADLASRYDSRFALQGLDPLAIVAVLVGAGLLGWLGAGLVTGHQLRQNRPRRA